jgi:hypothetical protein
VSDGDGEAAVVGETPPSAASPESAEMADSENNGVPSSEQSEPEGR